MRLLVLLVWIFMAGLTLNAQTLRDSILVNERKIDRPLTLHKGQLQFNTGYEISVISKEYDNSGSTVSLADMGIASILHKYYFELNYGLLDFIQTSIALNYARRGQRHETLYLWTTNSEVPDYEVTYFDEYTGFEDIYLGGVFKVPFETDRIEITLSPGISLPLFSNKPEAPENSIVLPTEAQPTTKIVYHSHQRMGNGSLAVKAGTTFLLRLPGNVNVSARVNYSGPFSVSKSIRWIHQLEGSDFIYDDIPYEYLLGNTWDYKADLTFPVISWFSATLSWSGRNTSEGWSEKTGYRIKNSDVRLSVLSVGYEIIASGRLWISESMNIPISGKNQLAPFSIYLGVCYNLFPFEKRIKY